MINIKWKFKEKSKNFIIVQHWSVPKRIRHTMSIITTNKNIRKLGKFEINFINERKQLKPFNLNEIPTEYDCIHLECKIEANLIDNNLFCNKNKNVRCN